MALEQLLNDIQGLLLDITSSSKGSIGGLDNIYICQLNRKRCDELLIELCSNFEHSLKRGQMGEKLPKFIKLDPKEPWVKAMRKEEKGKIHKIRE